MANRTVHFVGVLANVDSSILEIDLNHGFKIEHKSLRKGIDLISRLESLSIKSIAQKLLPLSCYNYSEKKYYVVTNSFESDIEMNNKGTLTSFPVGVARFDNKFFHGYLDRIIRLMRLFKEGNVVIPLKYYYLIEKNRPKMLIGSGTHVAVSEEPYALEPTDIPKLLLFIRDTALPFANPFLQLAFGAFELSYEATHMGSSFLSLMIGLETLLNPGYQVRYRVSRNVAVLLEKAVKDLKEIFCEVRDLYDKRSKLVHTGKLDTIDKEDISRSRYYLRESIKEINRIGKKKDELIRLLNSYGFGKRPWNE